MNDAPALFDEHDLKNRLGLLNQINEQLITHFSDCFMVPENKKKPYIDGQKRGRHGPPARLDFIAQGDYRYDAFVRVFDLDFMQVRFETDNPAWPKKHTRIFDDIDNFVGFLFEAFVNEDMQKASRYPAKYVTAK